MVAGNRNTDVCLNENFLWITAIADPLGVSRVSGDNSAAHIAPMDSLRSPSGRRVCLDCLLPLREGVEITDRRQTGVSYGEIGITHSGRRISRGLYAVCDQARVLEASADK